MQLWKKVVYSLNGLIFSSGALAAGWAPTTPPPPENLAPFWRPVITLSGGVFWPTQLGKSQEFFLEPSTYTYNTHKNNQGRGIFGGFGGLEFTLNPMWAMQLGASYYQTSSMNTSGVVHQGIDLPSSDNFNYHYDLTSRQVLAEGKLLMNNFERFHPYVSLGLGASFNRASNYNVHIPNSITFSPKFADYSNNSFSYSVGTGVDMDIIPHLRLGLGYRFADLGKANLGAGRIDNVPISHTLQQSNLYTNQLLAQLTWVF